MLTPVPNGAPDVQLQTDFAFRSVLPNGQTLNMRDAMGAAKGAPPKARAPGAQPPKSDRQPG